jgi:hypothetical protein
MIQDVIAHKGSMSALPCYRQLTCLDRQSPADFWLIPLAEMNNLCRR